MEENTLNLDGSSGRTSEGYRHWAPGAIHAPKDPSKADMCRRKINPKAQRRARVIGSGLRRVYSEAEKLELDLLKYNKKTPNTNRQTWRTRLFKLPMQWKNYANGTAKMFRLGSGMSYPVTGGHHA